MSYLPLIRAATQSLIEHVDELTELDQAIGDGDHGLNMKRGAQAIQARLGELEGQPPNEMLKAAGVTCMSVIGGASGPVFGTLLVTLAKALPAEPGPADVAAALQSAIAAVTRLGKAEVGQKTLIDVLDPVARALAEGGPGLIARTRTTALDSAAATATTSAIKGRASFLGERALGHVDPGSRSTALIIVAVCDTLEAHDAEAEA